MTPILLTLALAVSTLDRCGEPARAFYSRPCVRISDAVHATSDEWRIRADTARWMPIAPDAASVAPAQSSSPIPTRIAVSAFMVGQFTDISITQHYIGAGVFQEANPLLRPLEQKPVAMAAVKGSVAVAISWLLLLKHNDNPKAVFWTSVALASVQAAVTYHNYQESRR